MPEIKLYKSPKKAIRIILLTLPFVIIGIFMINSDKYENIIMGWVSICFFGLGIPTGLFHLLDKRPQIIINEHGIFDRTAHKTFINWEIISDAYIVDVHKQTFICLILNDDIEIQKGKSRIKKKVEEFGEMMGFQKFNISLGQIKIDAEKFREFILLMANADKSVRKQKLINNEGLR